MSEAPNQKILRTLPKVDVLLDMADYPDIPRVYLLDAVRRVLEEARASILKGELAAAPAPDELLERAASEAKRDLRPSLRPLINATGVILHTNLGRSILAPEAAEHALKLATSYSTLEYDAERGCRGSRHGHLEKLLTRLTDCEAAMAVNNNAAAMLLIMAALFRGREVIVSVGELVEIGGSFRIPEIMEQGGAILRAVGTTNKTRLTDYSRAVNPATGGLMRVHTSNFRVIGYTEQTPTDQLAGLARQRGLPLVCDLGSGSLIDLKPLGIMDEPTVTDELKAGADIVAVSGDKLLGGPQAGIILGRRECVEILKSHPLARALRLDKLTLAALSATLRLYFEPEKAISKIPTLNMLFTPESELKTKAALLKQKLTAANPRLTVELIKTAALTGGGSAPEHPLPSWAAAIKHPQLSAAALEKHLRANSIIARIEHDRVIVDVRAVKAEELDAIASALSKIFEFPHFYNHPGKERCGERGRG